jgi:DNA (cytosine-5)-methyltransferase 1
VRPRLLDLFCGAGGCGVGYQRAGFDVVGVDKEAHPSSPHLVMVADALEVLDDWGFCSTFDVIHASPPCQAHTNASNRWRGAGGKADSHPDLVGPVRAALRVIGKPYVIENVVGARNAMRDVVILHGGMFGLGVHRPRLFEVSVPIGAPLYAPAPVGSIGVYGVKPDGRRLYTRTDGSEQRAAKGLAEGQRAMGIDWMEWHDLTEAIPPAYTQWIGEQLLAVLDLERAA